MLQSRLMFLNQNPELVLRSWPTITNILLPRCLLGICTTIFLLGLSAFFLTARTLYIILQGWGPISFITFVASNCKSLYMLSCDGDKSKDMFFLLPEKIFDIWWNVMYRLVLQAHKWRWLQLSIGSLGSHIMKNQHPIMTKHGHRLGCWSR